MEAFKSGAGGADTGVVSSSTESDPALRQPLSRAWYSPSGLWQHQTTTIATLSLLAIVLHLVLRFGFGTAPGVSRIPLFATFVFGLPLLYDLLRKLLRREFGSDLLGGISIVTSILLGEYLAV
jgi:hypothetical protein